MSAPGREHGMKAIAAVIDDDVETRRLLTDILAKSGFEVLEGSTGEEAVEIALARRPDVIFLDIVLQGMGGIEALERLRDEEIDTPVVVISGVEDTLLAERALHLGAANFVRKPFDPAEIAFVVGRIRSALEEAVDFRPVLPLLRERRTVIEMGNEVGLVARVVAYLARELRLQYPGVRLPIARMRLALFEAVANAIQHGNLEIGHRAKSEALAVRGGLAALIERRRGEAPYKDRSVRVEVEYRPERVTYSVRDQGPGFAHVNHDVAWTLEDTSARHGRGLLLIRHSMDDVRWNADGNEIQLVLTIAPDAG